MGAGASDGYPLGAKLIEILSSFKNKIPKDGARLGMAEKEWGFYEVIARFSHDLKLSCATSIDFYTSRISDETTKDIIRSLIISVIKHHYLEKEDSWYGHILPLVFPVIAKEDDGAAKLKKIRDLLKKIKIITFNYDVSLERFLYDFLLKNIFANNENDEFFIEAKKEIFSKVNHVYGSVVQDINDYYFLERTTLPLYYDANNRSRLDIYSSNWINSVFKMAYEIYSDNNFESIKLMENHRDSEIKVSSCYYLYIFGFGFDQMNIDKIEVNQSCWKKGCFITNYEDNQMIKRIILNNLCGAPNMIDQTLKVPVISINKVKNALSKDFSLIERPAMPELIPSDQTMNGRFSPYFALIKHGK